MLNEINCKPKKRRKSKKKLKSFILNNQKNQYTENKCRCQDKDRMILTRMLTMWAQCKEQRNKKTSLIFES